MTVRPLHSSAKSELVPKEMSKNHCSLRGQGGEGGQTCVLLGDKKRNDSSRLIALLIATPSSIPSRRKPLPRPFVSMETEEPEKSRTGLPYHFHRWRKVVRIICRDSHVASSHEEKCPRKKESDLYHFGNVLCLEKWQIDSFRKLIVFRNLLEKICRIY